MALRRQRPHRFVHQRGREQRHAIGSAGGQRDAQVLLVKPDAKPRCEVPIQDPLPVDVESLAGLEG